MKGTESSNAQSKGSEQKTEAKQNTTLLQAQTDLLLYAEEDTPTAIPCLDVVAFAVGHRRKLCKQLSL